ncbi:MAG TPA: hypothetical protein VHX44_15820, partial [Planctomycetota bacterium]|nr:hypothetical protein [Planctomycetota bacterium]
MTTVPGMRSLIVLLAFIILCPAEELVGARGVLARLQADGNATVPLADLRRAVQGDLDTVLASHPQAPLSDLLTVLPKRVASGYLAYGFPRTLVTANSERDHLALHIIEGPRFRCGVVSIDGAGAVSAKELSDWLTLEHPQPNDWTQPETDADKEADKEADKNPANGTAKEIKMEQPLWVTGEPTDFQPHYLRSAEARVIARHRQAARLGALATATLVERPDGIADLHIHIDNAGELAQVESVMIEGLTRTPRDQVEHLLGLHEGMPVGPATVATLEAKLLDSGRFRFQRARLDPTKDPTRYRLTVTVGESRNIPVLPQPFSPEAEAMLRARAWLLDQLAGVGDDLVVQITWKDARYEFVLSPGQGFLLRYDQKQADGRITVGGVSMAGPRVTYVSGASQAGIRATMDQICTLEVGLAGGEKEPDPEWMRDSGSFTFNVGFKSRDDGDLGASLRVAATIAPASVLTWVYDPTFPATLADGTLLIGSGDGPKLACDARTGRLRDIVVDPMEGVHVSFSFTPKAFAGRLADFDHAVEQVSWRNGAGATFGSFVGLLADDLTLVMASWMDVVTDAKDRQTMVMIRELLANSGTAMAWLEPVMDLIRTALDATKNDEPEEQFFIPVSLGMQMGLQEIAALFVARAAGVAAEHLPIDSWPLVLARGTIS